MLPDPQPRAPNPWLGGTMDYLVVSDDRTFMISNHDGDILPGEGGLGLYYHDTRHLSELRLRLNGQAPNMLGYSDEDVYQAHIQLGNAPFESKDGTRAGRHTV